MELRPIVIEGAVDTELDYLISKLDNIVEINENGYFFYSGSIMEYPIIIVKTGIATINATISTMISINKYNPIAIINEGTAGSHVLDIKKGDLIIGKEIIKIDGYKTNVKVLGEGSNSLDWKITDFQHSLDGECVVYKADENMINVANGIKKLHTQGKIYNGRVGSGDIFNREADKINLLHKKLQTICEEMEGAAVYATATRFGIPVIGFRIISNNELLGESYDVSYGKYSQEFTYNFVKHYIKFLGEQ